MYKVCSKYCYSIIQCVYLGFSPLVPPPVVTVSVDPVIDPIYSSTAVNFTCTAVLAEVVDTATVAIATWTGAFGQQPTDPNRISVIPAVNVAERRFESILVFLPVDFEEDSGLHICDIIISSNTMFSLQDSLIEDATNNGNTVVIIKGWSNRRITRKTRRKGRIHTHEQLINLTDHSKWCSTSSPQAK